jgi:hypothetical protein
MVLTLIFLIYLITLIDYRDFLDLPDCHDLVSSNQGNPVILPIMVKTILLDCHDGLT